MPLSIQVQFPGRLCLPHDLFIFFTVRKSSCGKVMFSQTCVKNSVHRGQVYTPLDTHTHTLEIHPLEHTPLDTHLLRTRTHQHRIQRQGRGGNKHEIYVAAFGSHLFYDLFVQVWGGHGPLGTPLDPLLHTHTPQTLTPLPRWPLKQTVHILLECTLVFYLHLIHLCRMYGVFTYAQISQSWHLCVNLI